MIYQIFHILCNIKKKQLFIILIQLYFSLSKIINQFFYKNKIFKFFFLYFFQYILNMIYMFLIAIVNIIFRFNIEYYVY